jgi:hypothetical protein
VSADFTPTPRASHVNSGTSVPREELLWPEKLGQVMCLPKVHVEVDGRAEVTPYGGLDLAVQFVRRFGVAEAIDSRVHVLKLALPYYESDHVLAQVFNLYVGGTCVEDQANLQNDSAVLRLLGACRLPDPTTAGDFLRRFKERDNPGSLEGLRSAVDAIQDGVWRKLRRGRKRKRQWAVVDMDGHIKELYGEQKEGADFSHKGQWAYHPLLVSLAGTGECLAVRNRPGNVQSPEGAPEVLGEVLPRVRAQFPRVLVRADSAFDRKDVREAVQRSGAHFAFVGREFPDRPGIAASIPEEQWRPYRSRPQREGAERRRKKDFRSRGKKRNQRNKRARERGYRNLRLVKQWVAEVPWRPRGSEQTLRLVIRRQLIEESCGQRFLFNVHRYRYVVTDLPEDCSTEQAMDLTYQRCDQENVIEQMGSGLAVWRMPVAEFEGNAAWLEIGRLAWNLGKWIAQLALPAEVVRWEWKRFRHALVYVAAQVLRRARQIWVRLAASHRFTHTLVAAHVQLQR